MSTEDTIVVHIDRSTAMLVDAFRNTSMFRPSRRQAVRALLRRALREMQKQDAAPAPAGEQVSA